MKLEEMTLAQFAEQLAAKTPVPGGGGASALMGALGAAEYARQKGLAG